MSTGNYSDDIMELRTKEDIDRYCYLENFEEYCSEEENLPLLIAQTSRDLLEVLANNLVLAAKLNGYEKHFQINSSNVNNWTANFIPKPNYNGFKPQNKLLKINKRICLILDRCAIKYDQIKTQKEDSLTRNEDIFSLGLKFLEDLVLLNKSGYKTLNFLEPFTPKSYKIHAVDFLKKINEEEGKLENDINLAIASFSK